MKFNSETYEVIRGRMLDSMNNDVDKREGSFVSNMVSPVGTEFAKYYLELDNLLAIMFLEDSTNEFLDKKVHDFGVYRKLGQSAKGFIKVTGTNGTHIPKGSIVVSQGDLEFYTLNGAWINEGMAIIEVEASDVGEQYNIIPNSIEKFSIKISGVESVINEEIFEGGINTETDEELRERFFEIIRRPATSGNVYHYEQWAKEVDGINQSKVKPLWQGPGTVKVIVTNDNMMVEQDIVEACKAHIEKVRPIGAEVTVVTPTAIELNISAEFIMNDGYDSMEAKLQFENNLIEYLSSCEEEVIYNKVASCLGEIEGIRDYRNLLINSSTSNITFHDEQLPVIKSIILSEVV